MSDVDETEPRRPRALVPAAGLLAAALAVVAAVLLHPGVRPDVQAAVANLAETVLAGSAAATALWWSRRCSGRRRRSWTAIGLGAAGWTAGQALWTWYELVADREVPFPSLADVGFLAFPVGLSIGLWLYPERGGWRQQRRLLDGLTVTAALLLVSWSTVLRAVVEAGADHPLAFAVSVAYPASDLVVLVLVVLMLAAGRKDRLALLLLGAGLVSFVIADSAFAYLTATESFSSGEVVDLGWMAGFALLALAPLASRETTASAEHDVTGRRPTLLPYVAVLVAALVLAFRRVTGSELEAAELLLMTAVVGLVLSRQFATLRENSQLVAVLAAREAELRHQAFHDGVTGLANRALFSDRLEHALELHRSDLRPLAVLLCDLDDFKVVNDTHGHAAGDELLLRVAERIRGSLRSADTLARLGGDEFAVLLEQGDEAEIVASRMADALDPPFYVGPATIGVRASIGVAVVLAGARTPTSSDLLVRADTAMYAAKRAGKGQVRVFEPGMSLVEVEEQRMAAALGQALARRELRVEYQPIVTVATGLVEGVECLARWTWDGREVPPSVFVPVAERTGLVAELTDFVLDTACAQLNAWARATGWDGVRIGVNIAPLDLVSGTLPRRVDAALRRHRIDADRLVLEITESGLLTDVAGAELATGELGRMGVRLALDDFGVGYSSLAHLHRIPLRILKIDRAFTAGLDVDEHQARFVRALLALGHDLGLAVVAEGVERPAQLALLRQLGCEMAQGYLLARPVTAAAVQPLLGEIAPIAAEELLAVGERRAARLG
jgi:diguanylate cyclase